MNVAGKEDAVLLFDLIAPYISDKSILNGAILIEFSPEAGQVFSVCYSDRVDNFDYMGGSMGSVVGEEWDHGYGRDAGDN